MQLPRLGAEPVVLVAVALLLAASQLSGCNKGGTTVVGRTGDAAAPGTKPPDGNATVPSGSTDAKRSTDLLPGAGDPPPVPGTTPRVHEQDDPALVPEERFFNRVKLATRVGRVMMIDVDAAERVFIAERDGALKIWKPDGAVVTAGQLRVFAGNEDGLLGVALDPAFATNGFVYVLFTMPTPTEHRLARFEMKGDSLDMASEKILLQIPEDRTECCHVGGGLEFDGQGNLFVALGDNTHPFTSNGYSPHDDRPGNVNADAQRTAANTNDLRGKILRIKPNADGTYAIPSGNLFPNGGGRPEIYVMGARNPFRLAVDRTRGWVYWGDVGPDACDGCDALTTRGPRGYDEFNLTMAPGNYGWPYCIADNKRYVAFNWDTNTSGAAFNCDAPVNNSRNNTGAMMLPVARPAWIHYSSGGSGYGNGGRTALAGAVYRWQPNGSSLKLPRAWDGSLFLMEYSRKWIRRVLVDDQGKMMSIEPFLSSQSWGSLISMRISPNGVMYVAEYSESAGAVYRVEFSTANRLPVAAATATPDTGAVPLMVTFSSMGSSDFEQTPLTFAWDFDGDGTTDSTAPNPSYTYLRPGLFRAKLTVSDGMGSSSVTHDIAAGNTRPTVTITSPPRGSFVSPGEKVDYVVSAMDSEDGAAACANVVVTSALGHDEHQHDGVPVNGCTGTITTATGLVPAENSWQILDARNTDSGPPPAPRLTAKASVLMHFKHLEAEHFEVRGSKNDVKTETTTDPTGGDLNVAYINHGSWICWNEMNFRNITSITYRVASAGLGGRIELRRMSNTGPVLATTQIPVTGGWQTWISVNQPITDPGGTERTCFVFYRNAGDKLLFNVNYIDFNGPGVSHP